MRILSLELQCYCGQPCQYLTHPPRTPVPFFREIPTSRRALCTEERKKERKKVQGGTEGCGGSSPCLMSGEEMAPL